MTLDGKCSDVNECELKVFPCAFGAKCLNTAGGYMCSCPPGTLGDAEIGGCTPAPLQKSCKISQNCNDDSECIGGICVNPCSRPNACGVNAVCMTSNHTKKCACRAGFEGDSELFCHKIVDCVTSNSCPGNLRCLNQKCACSQKEQRILDYCIGKLMKN